MKTYSNLQEVYDAAVAGLASQEFQGCYIEIGICAYRGANGRKCAIGWCIPDEVYTPGMEEKSIRTLLREFGDRLKDVFPPSISEDILAELQRCHDMPRDSEERRNMLREFGRRRNLRIPESLTT